MTFVLTMAIAISTGGCHEVIDGGRIMGRHLAAADERFSALPADLFIGYAPYPGAQRILRADELLRISKAQGLDLGPSRPICMSWAMKDPDAALFVTAMQESLGIPGARVEVVETSKQKLPPGKLVFPLGSMSAQTASSAELGLIWRGHVLYDENQRYSIWARVRVSAPIQRVVANTQLKRGEVITASQVRLEQVQGFPVKNPIATQLEDVIGRSPIVTINEGVGVQTSILSTPVHVSQDQIVEVHLDQGKVRFKF